MAQRIFTCSRKTNFYIDRKIKGEENSNTGRINAKIEQWLNNNGVFDDEIQKFSRDEVKEIEDIDMDKTSIYTSYYVVDDGDGDSLDESDMILLTDQETNDYIAQKYFNRKNNLKDILKDKIKKKNEKNDTILHRFGEALGIVPVGVQAET